MVDVTIRIQKLDNLSRKQRKLKEDFESAKSVDESLKAFKKMEPLFNESDLAMPCWTLAELLLRQARPQESFDFGKRALKILLDNTNNSNNVLCFGNYSAGKIKDCSLMHHSSFFIAKVCNVLGSACRVLKRFDEGLSYLNWTDRNLTTLENDEEEISCSGKCVWKAIEITHMQLYCVKFSTNRFAEAAIHRRRILEVKEKMLEEGCVEIGDASMKVCLAYYAAMNLKEALPFGLKTLEIQMKHLGSESVEVAETRRFLGWVYKDLGEHDKGLEQERLSESVLKEMNRDSPDKMIESGRYEEAIDVLKGMVSRDGMEDDTRAAAFVSMAKAFFKLGKLRDANKQMRTARKILDKKGLNQIYAALLIVDLSRLYEKMNDPETALSLIRKVLAIPELPPNLLSRGASRFFWLIPRRKVEQEIPYMLDLLEKLKVSFGPEHREVGYAYARLGIACWNAGQQELGVKFITNGKDIMDATIGPQHVDSLKTSHVLSIYYAKLGRYDLAHDIEEKVVKGLGPSEQKLLDEAVIFLGKLKVAAAAPPTSPSPQSEDDVEDLYEMISKCGISGDD